VNEQNGILSPSQMLEQLHVLVISALNKDATMRESNDGMDIGLLCIDKKAGKAFFSGAGRPLYYSDKNGLHFIGSDRYSIAGEKKAGDAPFSETEILLEGRTDFYLSSDGYVDQFGEVSGKKFLSKRFKEMLSNISELPMKEQRERIEKEFANWKGKQDQVDDVMVLGVRVN
jgi:serine phosphatase RsbU (regulator of sigma subunit)